MPTEALKVVDAWGFKLKNMNGFTWHKLTKHGHDHFGMGHWTRGNCESALIATKGKPRRISASVRQFVEAPIGKHSEKPPEVRSRISRLCGNLESIELFARHSSSGWDCWGNEAPKDRGQ